RGCRGGDRQCTDGALSPAGDDRRRRAQARRHSRISRGLRGRRRGERGACEEFARARLRDAARPARRQCAGGRGSQRAGGADAVSWLTVIGVGEDGLDGVSRAARTLVEQAEVLVGGARHLAMLPEGRAKRLAWRQPLTDSLPEIAAHEGRRVVVLASGDPLWYGLGGLLLRRFGREGMLVLPAPSAFSLAAARMGWPLAACASLTLHGRPLARLALFLAPGARLLILSEDGSTPASAAALLTRLGWGQSPLTALEHMGGPRERRVEGRAATRRGPRGGDLNTLAIECVAGPGARIHSRLAGLPDDAYRHDGQLTKRTVRAATLAALAPLPGEMLWDVGAGCGSIGIEWLRAGGGRAMAVE